MWPIVEQLAIRRLDEEIVQAAARRTALAREVGEEKLRASLPVVDYAQERAVLDRGRSTAQEAGLEPVSVLEDGDCFIELSKSTHRTCTGPIVVPPCALSFKVEVCASDPKFSYDPACSSAARQSAFFAFGENPLGRWRVVASGVDTFARTDPECTEGVPPQCVKGPTANANLSPSGTTIAIGKLITAGCNTFSVKVDITADQE
jgi:chorismate mutase